MSLTDSTYITPFIIGDQRPVGSKTFPVVNSVSPKDTLWSASSATLSDVEAVTAAASAAFPTWATTTLVKRRKILLKVADLLRSSSTELQECLTIEIAGRAEWAAFNCDLGADLAIHVASEVIGIAGSIPGVEGEERAALIVKEPLGVVLAIIPWNAPVVLLLRGILFALAAGNTVIVKSSELCPRTHYLLTSLIISAGFPPGVINLIGCSRQDAPEITEALISNRAIKKITFTGSTAIGRKIASVAGQHLKPVIMELGGKSPLIVCEDADIKVAANAAALGAFIYSGQVCMSTEKIILHSSIADAFTSELMVCVAAFGASQGLLVPGAQQRVKALVDNALSAGANIVNQEAYDNFKFDGGRDFPNLVLRNVTDKMDIYHQETFGPIVSLFVFDDEEEAIRLANDTDYGLVSAVWTRDLRKAFSIGKKIQAGTVNINGSTFAWEPALVSDGYKNSGYGKHVLDEFLLWKVITYDA